MEATKSNKEFMKASLKEALEAGLPAPEPSTSCITWFTVKLVLYVLSHMVLNPQCLTSLRGEKKENVGYKKLSLKL